MSHSRKYKSFFKDELMRRKRFEAKLQAARSELQALRQAQQVPQLLALLFLLLVPRSSVQGLPCICLVVERAPFLCLALPPSINPMHCRVPSQLEMRFWQQALLQQAAAAQ